MTDNDNVIVTMGKHTDKTTYHTKACPAVRQMDGKLYIEQKEAESRRYDKCTYCKDEFDPTYGNQNTLYHKLEQMDPEDLPADG